MISTAAMTVKSDFDKKGVYYIFDEKEQYQIIYTPFRIENGPIVDILFVFSEDNDISAKLFIPLKLSDSYVDKVKDLIIKLNDEYRFVKFVLDSDNDISLEYDFLSSTKLDYLAESVFELLIRFMSIADEVYPSLMKLIWVGE